MLAQVSGSLLRADCRSGVGAATGTPVDLLMPPFAPLIAHRPAPPGLLAENSVPIFLGPRVWVSGQVRQRQSLFLRPVPLMTASVRAFPVR